MKVSRMVVKTEEVLLLHDDFYKAAEIAKVLKEIEKREGFVGFLEIHFKQDELPRIIYYTELGEKKTRRDD